MLSTNAAVVPSLPLAVGVTTNVVDKGYGPSAFATPEKVPSAVLNMTPEGRAIALVVL